MSKLDEIRARIAASRDHYVFRMIASASQKYLRAYDNQLNWDIRVNGEAAALRRVVEAVPGDILDVGANEGQWARMALDVIGPSRRLHCFEVVPETYRALRRNLGAHPNVLLNDFGLSAEERQLELFFYPESSDRSSAFHLDDGFAKKSVEGRVLRGDDYLRARAITQVAYLKIDVEGMEMEVLDGFDRSLRAGIISAVQFEHGASHVMSRHFLKDFVEFFQARRYTLFRCYPNALRPLHYDMGVDESFAGQNFVALSAEAQGVCRL